MNATDKSIQILPFTKQNNHILHLTPKTSAIDYEITPQNVTIPLSFLKLLQELLQECITQVFLEIYEHKLSVAMGALSWDLSLSYSGFSNVAQG